jgi:hypothetical protein
VFHAGAAGVKTGFVERLLAKHNPNGTIDITIKGPGGVLSEFQWGAGGLSWTRDSIYAGSQPLATTRPAVLTTLTLEDLVGEWWILGEDIVWRPCSIADLGDGN